MCDTCLPLWERAGSEEGNDWTIQLTAAALRVRPDIALDGYGLRSHAQAVAAGQADPAGCDEPFGYLPSDVLDACRRNWWRRHPTEAPPDVQKRMARLRAAEAAVAASREPAAPAPVLALPLFSRRP